MSINFKDIHPAQYFSLRYLFQVDRVVLHLSDWIFLGIGVGLVAAAIITKLFALFINHPVRKHLLDRFFKAFLFTGLVEALWFGFRYENANVIGTHFVALLVLLIGLLCLIPIIKYYFTKYSPEREQWDKEQLKLKYIKG